jgi:S-adenosylmethionine synthetase
MIFHPRQREPFYLKTATYEHFGQSEFSRERVDAMEELLSKAKHA